MPYEEKTKSYEHQLRARDKARGRDGFAYLMEMGTGKTKCAIDELSEDFQNGDVEQALILAPNGVYSNWALREIPTHMPDDVRDETFVHLWDGGGTKRERDTISDMMRETDANCILNMNLEAIGSSDKAWTLANDFVKRRPTAIIVDESTRIKNPDTILTKSLMRFAGNSAKRRILTGYPNPNSPMDLFSQMDFAVPGSLGTNYYSFRHKYAVTKEMVIGMKTLRDGRVVPNKTKIIVAYQNQGELARRLERHSFRALKKDCLDLPPENYHPPRKVEMTNEQWRAYREMVDVCTTELAGSKYVTATLIITQLLRLHQIVCGFVTTDDREEVPIKNKRLKAMEEHVEEWCGRPGIVWCNYQFNVREVTQKLGEMFGPKKVVGYHGGLSQRECDINLDRFQKHGDADYIVATPAKGGFGVTMTRAADDLFYSNTENLEHRLQSEARTHRSGQKNPVNHGDLVCEGTVDWKIMNSLREKIDLATVVLGDGYQRWVI